VTPAVTIWSTISSALDDRLSAEISTAEHQPDPGGDVLHRSTTTHRPGPVHQAGGS
jgi:hypothetical protein